GGAATSAFGGRGAVTFLSKVTAVCAGMFFLTSLGLSFVGLRSSVAEKAVPAAAAKTETTVPVVPADGKTPDGKEAATKPAAQGIEQGGGSPAPAATSTP